MFTDGRNLVVKSLIEGLKKSPKIKICIADSDAEESPMREYMARIDSYEIQNNGVVTVRFDGGSIIFSKHKISGTYQVKGATWIAAHDWEGRYFTLETAA